MKTNLKNRIALIIVSASFLVLAVSCKKDAEDDPSVIKDGDGNVYTTVTIDTQTWLLENLKTTKLNDGTKIPLVTDLADWIDLTTMGYCWYDNNEATYKGDYGALYNWYAAKNDKLCPKGWHVPNNADWTTLITSLGGADFAGGKMKELGTTHWRAINEGANNESGFTALPGGRRDNDHNDFIFIREVAYFWSSTEYSATDAWVTYLGYYNATVFESEGPKNMGFSVRCIKN
jgi:uncharacterized protein (TIGR02145 family)